MPSIVTNFKFRSNSPNFERDQVRTIKDLRLAEMCDYDIGHIVYCIENNKHYAFGIDRNSINGTIKYNKETGYFAELRTGVGEGSGGSNDDAGVRIQIAYTRAAIDHTATEDQIADLGLPTGWYWDTKNDIVAHIEGSDIDGNGWAIDDSKLNRTDENGNPLQLWQSVGVFYLSDPDTGHWGTPYCLSARPGEDGATIEFIYARTIDETTIPELPSGYENDEGYQSPDFFPTYDEGNVPEGIVGGSYADETPRYWFDNPQGISQKYQCEWFCQRFRKDGIWGPFSDPVLWSKWGVVGRDGDGLEYIYNKRSVNDVPPLPEFCSDEDFDVTAQVQVKQDDGAYIDVDYQADEYIPNGEFKYTFSDGTTKEETIGEWLDEPGGVSIDEPWEFVSIRKFNRKTGTWGKFSKPVLWAHYSRQGFRSYVFTKSMSKPATPVDNAIPFEVEDDNGKTITIAPTTASHPIPVDPDLAKNQTWDPKKHVIWYDGIPDNDNPFDDDGASNGKITAPLYMSWKDFYIGEKGEESTGWSEPAIMKDSNDMLVEYNNSDTLPEDPVGEYGGEYGENGIDPHGWYDPYDPNSISKNVSNGAWTEEDLRDYVDDAIWMAMLKLNNGVPVGEWTIVKIKGEDGEDGTSIKVMGTYDTYEALETARINTISVNDGEVSGGFKSYDKTNYTGYEDQITKEPIKQYNPNMGDTYLVKNVNVMAKDGTWRAITTADIYYKNSKGLASYNPTTVLPEGIDEFNNGKDESEHIALFTNGAFTWDGDSWVFVGKITGDSNYVHIKYSDNPGVLDKGATNKKEINNSLKDVPTDDNVICKYMGICVHGDINPPVNVTDDEGNVTKYAYEFYKWSKFAGEDGFGYEYIYMRSRGNNPENPDLPIPPDDEKPGDYDDLYQKPEYVPGDYERGLYEEGTVDDGKGGTGEKYTWWTDEQQGVSEEYPYEWMTWRKYSKENGKWGEWKGDSDGKAFLQNVWNGMEFTSFVFTRLKYDIDLTEATVEGGTFSNPIPTKTTYGTTEVNHTGDNVAWQWHDSVPTGSAGNIWMTQARFNIGMDGETNSPTWSKPVIMNDTTEQDVDWCPYAITDPGTPDNPDTAQYWFENVYTDTDADGDAEQKWPVNEKTKEKLPAIWMAVRPLKNGSPAGDWVITRIHGEKGDKGDPGTSINIKGRYNTTHDLYFAWMGLDCMTEIDDPEADNTDGTLSTNNPPKESDSYIISNNITSYSDEAWTSDATGEYVKVTGPISVDDAGNITMGSIIQSPSTTGAPSTAHSIYVSKKDFESSVMKNHPNVQNLSDFISANSYKPNDGVIETNYGHIYVYVPGAFDSSLVNTIDGYSKYNVWEDCGKFTGNDGQSAYTHIKYSNDPRVMDKSISEQDVIGAINDSMSESPVETDKDGNTIIIRKYMGIYSNNEVEDKDDYTLYKWSKFVGEDGFGYEYIYKLSDSETLLDAPESENEDGFLPTDKDGKKWSDGRLQVTSEYPYEHMFWRRKETSPNGVFEWSGWKGQKGSDGNEQSIISNRFVTATHTPMCSLSVSPKTVKLIGDKYSDDLTVQIIKKTGDDYETLTPGSVDGITVKYRIDGDENKEYILKGNTLSLSETEVKAKNNIVINLEDRSNDIIDTETIFVLQDNNAYIADFTDDSYSIACSAGGKPINTGELKNFSTTFNVYKGINKSEITNFVVKERYVEGNHYPGFTIKAVKSAVKSDQTVERTIIVPKHYYNGTKIEFRVSGTSTPMSIDEFQTEYLTLSGINSDDIVLSTFTSFDDSTPLVLDYVCTGTTDNTDRSATFSIKKIQPGGTAPSKYVIVPNTYGIDLVDNKATPDSFRINEIVRYYFDENGSVEKSEKYERLSELGYHFDKNGLLGVYVYYEDNKGYPDYNYSHEYNFSADSIEQWGSLLSDILSINTFVKANGARATHIICELNDGSQNVADMYIPITRNGVPGTMYILNPTADVIKAKTSIVGGTKTTTFSPNSINVYLNHIVGNAITQEMKFTLGLSSDGNLSRQEISTTNGSVSLTLDGTNGILTEANTTEYSYLNVSYTYTGDDGKSVIIAKTIPILYDGESGEVTDVYSLQCSSDVIKVDKSGTHTPTVITPLALKRQGSDFTVLQTSESKGDYQIWIILKTGSNYYALSNHQSTAGSDTYYVALSNQINSTTYLTYNINQLVNNLKLVKNSESYTLRDIPGFFGINAIMPSVHAIANRIVSDDVFIIGNPPTTTKIQDGQSLEVYLIGGLNSTPKILDHESIPILKDGEDTYTVNLSNDLIAIACDANGKPHSTGAYKSTVSVYKGTSSAVDGSYSIALDKNYGDRKDWTATLSNGIITVNVPDKDDIINNDEVQVNVTVDGVTITKTLKVIAVKDGQQGESKSGKIPYYAGEYSGSTPYQQTDTATPYVFYNNGTESGYYLLISNSARGVAPPNGNYWLKMTEFEAMYANVGVIKQALVGGAVFDKEWMYSQDGFEYTCNVTSADIETAIAIGDLNDAYNNTDIKQIIDNKKLFVHNIDNTITDVDSLFYHGKYGYNRPLNVPVNEDLLCAFCAGYYVPLKTEAAINSASGTLFINGLQKTYGSNHYLFISISTGQGATDDKALAKILLNRGYTIYRYTLNELTGTNTVGDIGNSIKARRFNVETHVNGTNYKNISSLSANAELRDNIGGNYIYSVTGHILYALFDVIIKRNSVSKKYENFDSTLAKTLPYASSLGVFSPNWAVNLKTGSMWTGGGLCSMRKDGSGHLANGRISWDVDGNLYLPPTGTLSMTATPDNTALTFKYYVANGTSLTPAGPVNVQIKFRAVYSNGTYKELKNLTETFNHSAAENFPFSNRCMVAVASISDAVLTNSVSDYDRITATLYIDNMPSQEIDITDYIFNVFIYNLITNKGLGVNMNIQLCGYIDEGDLSTLGANDRIYEKVATLQTVGGIRGASFSDNVIEESIYETFDDVNDFDQVICVLKLQHIVDLDSGEQLIGEQAKIKLGRNVDYLCDFGTNGKYTYNTVNEINLTIPAVSGYGDDNWYYIGIKPAYGLSSGDGVANALLTGQ